ncbi:hypothetical protein [Deinococcus hopiensis]|uniref:Uncharacterized protein n=1 Tax=Deinococcus hopiensis KR-140 TaxID=695939 RepID=A0A1W1UQ61_9DEIO|nr:hypothetical protein [Deinococcus hopiensis]SMB83242.1 hypothetical protein SAMN00790413_04324 [Deinococcus hopiensis KR-140]
MTQQSPSRIPPQHALTRNVLRAIHSTPQLNKTLLQTQLDVLLEGFNPERPEHQQAVQSALTIIRTVAVQEGVIRTAEQLAVLETDLRLLGLVQELLIDAKETPVLI